MFQPSAYFTVLVVAFRAFFIVPMQEFLRPKLGVLKCGLCGVKFELAAALILYLVFAGRIVTRYSSCPVSTRILGRPFRDVYEAD